MSATAATAAAATTMTTDTPPRRTVETLASRAHGLERREACKGIGLQQRRVRHKVAERGDRPFGVKLLGRRFECLHLGSQVKGQRPNIAAHRGRIELWLRT